MKPTTIRRSAPRFHSANAEHRTGVRPRARATLLWVAATLALLTAALFPAPAHACMCSASDTLAAGQAHIDEGQYDAAIKTFTCVIAAHPKKIDAYRGRAEARLMLGQYSEAYRDLYARLISAVQPSDILALGEDIIASYDARLAANPSSVPALRGGAFARWSYYTYEDAIPLLDQLLQADPNSVFALLFRGSNRLFAGVDIAAAQADIDAAIALAPNSADVRYVAADAYTYALPDLDRAYEEACLALDLGLDTPRVRAILGAGLAEQGDELGAAEEIEAHIDQSATMNVHRTPLANNQSKRVHLAPGKVFNIPVHATAGEVLHIRSSTPSANVYDSILVLLDPSGNPVVGSDDFDGFFAGLDWTVPATGTYTLRITSFEAIFTGPLDVTRGTPPPNGGGNGNG